MVFWNFPKGDFWIFLGAKIISEIGQNGAFCKACKKRVKVNGYINTCPMSNIKSPGIGVKLYLCSFAIGRIGQIEHFNINQPDCQDINNKCNNIVVLSPNFD